MEGEHADRVTLGKESRCSCHISSATWTHSLKDYSSVRAKFSNGKNIRIESEPAPEY